MFNRIRSAFRLFIATMRALTEALTINSATIAALAAEQKATGAEIERHLQYLAEVKRKERAETGHKD